VEGLGLFFFAEKFFLHQFIFPFLSKRKKDKRKIKDEKFSQKEGLI